MARKNKGADDGAESGLALDDQSSDEQGTEASADDADDGLVAVHKDGETLRVHPTCVKAHHAAGWKR